MPLSVSISSLFAWEAPGSSAHDASGFPGGGRGLNTEEALGERGLRSWRGSSLQGGWGWGWVRCALGATAQVPRGDQWSGKVSGPQTRPYKACKVSVMRKLESSSSLACSSHDGESVVGKAAPKATARTCGSRTALRTRQTHHRDSTAAHHRQCSLLDVAGRQFPEPKCRTRTTEHA